MAQQIWEKSYPSDVSWSSPMPPPVAVESFLENSAQRWQDKQALDFYGCTFTYNDLVKLASQVAKGLQSLGVGPGVHVGLHLVNTPHYIACFFGVLMAGGTVVNFSALAAPREIERQLLDSDTSVMITLNAKSLYPQVAAQKGKAKLHTVIVCSMEDFLPATVANAMIPPAERRIEGPGREVEFSQLTANDGAFVRHRRGPLEDEIAVLQYTGGTTGDPKGAMLTHASFSSVIRTYKEWTGDRIKEGAEKGLVVLPLFHIFGLTSTMINPLSRGNEIVLHLRFDADRWLEDVARKRITAFGGVPTMYGALVNHPRIKEYDLSSLQRCGSGGAPLPVEVLHRFKELTGLTPKEGYGLTETAPLATMQLTDGLPVAGTVGLVAPHTLIEIVDLETGSKVLPQGEKGEICISGPQLMKGYWKRPQATAEAFRGGRFHTGDIGFLNPQGYLTLVDRSKDMILSGGYNVFPRTVEEAIYEHPCVAEVTVIGIPDEHRGQAAKAFIALKPGANAFTFEELSAFLKERIAKYEMPVEMEFRDSLPKTAVGKLTKKELIAEEMAKRGKA